MKEFMKEVAAGICLVLLVIFGVALAFLGMALVHGLLMEFFANNCYTNLFGEVICKMP